MNNTSVKKTITLGDGTKLMDMGDGSYKAFKFFLSAVAEEKWLNRMAAYGYEFVERTVSGHIFVCNNLADELYFSVMFSSVSSSKGELCDITAAEASARKEEGSELITTYRTKVYYKTARKEASSSAAPVKDAENKRRHMRNVFVFNFSMLCFFLGLLCYNLMYWVRFSASNTLAEVIKNPDGSYILEDYISKEYSLWNYVYDLSDSLGKFPSTPHVFVFACLTLVFVPFAIYYLDQYLYARKFEKNIKTLWKNA